MDLDVMKEISGFLAEYESCVRGNFPAVVVEGTSDGTLESIKHIENTPNVDKHITTYTNDNTGANSPDSADSAHEAFASTSEPPPEITSSPSLATSTTVSSSKAADRCMRDIDGIIKISQEAQNSVLGLANDLQGLFHSVMTERNQAVDDLKKSVNLLRYSVDKLQKMREKIDRMDDREEAVAASEAAVHERQAEVARLETDLARRMDDVTLKQNVAEKQLAEHARRLDEVASKETAVNERATALDRQSTDLSRRMECVASKEGALDALQRTLNEQQGQMVEQRHDIDARTEELARRERALKTELLVWDQTLQEKESILRGIQNDIANLSKEKMYIEKNKREAMEGVKAAREELETTEARLRALRERADEIEAAQEPARLTLEANRAEIESIRRERESFEALKRDIVVQGHKAIESAERCRAEQMTLALIKRENIQKASQLYMNHLEAAMEFGRSPEFLGKLRALLHRHFHNPGVGDVDDVDDVDEVVGVDEDDSPGIHVNLIKDASEAGSEDGTNADINGDFKIKSEIYRKPMTSST